MKNPFYLIFAIIAFCLLSCDKGDKPETMEQTMTSEDSAKYELLKQRIEMYAPTVISNDLSNLTERQRKVIELLVEAGKIADEIFWKQNSPDGIRVRDSLNNINNSIAKEQLKYLLINYGPYDVIFENARFVGVGPAAKPSGANLYPVDLTKEEFEAFIEVNPELKEQFQSEYTLIKRDGNGLKAIPYHQAYPESQKIAKLLDEAAEYADDPALKNYLTLRAKALRIDDYLESDMAWMDLHDGDIDLVLGPIENYIDGFMGYKTAWEVGIFVKDEEATQELEIFKKYIDSFEQKLPYDKKYIRKSVGELKNILNIVNVVYFGGDFQEAIKTIATSLPNDPRVREQKGSKNLMFKNMMEAKFHKIVVPIAEILLEESLLPFVNAKAFTSFVTFHEVSHTLGRGWVYGNDKLPVREALKEHYAAIEETKADILSMYNHQHLLNEGIYTKEYIKNAMVTYLAGIFRSIRFGADRAHGKANMIQLNYLMENGAITYKDGKYSINEKIFFDKVADLANLILTCQATGNYKQAGEIIEKYGNMSEQVKSDLTRLSSVPRDLNTTYEF